MAAFLDRHPETVAAMMTSQMCPVAHSCCRIDSFAQKPTNGGTPAVENINAIITSASSGSRLYRPL